MTLCRKPQFFKYDAYKLFFTLFFFSLSFFYISLTACFLCVHNLFTHFTLAVFYCFSLFFVFLLSFIFSILQIFCDDGVFVVIFFFNLIFDFRFAACYVVNAYFSFHFFQIFASGAISCLLRWSQRAKGHCMILFLFSKQWTLWRTSMRTHIHANIYTKFA